MHSPLTALRRIFRVQDWTGLSDEELADLGLSRVDYAVLCETHVGSHQRMAAMAARFGLTLDEVLADEALGAEATALCGHCADASTCRMAIAGEAEFPVGRCPNAETYAALAAENGAPASAVPSGREAQP
ncbi:MAG: hypothetical protein AAFU80_22085 [Pseudomonadota bacterium]